MRTSQCYLHTFTSGEKNMAARCLFGIFVFDKNSSLVYRFLTNDLFTHLRTSFIDRGYSFDDNDQVRNLRLLSNENSFLSNMMEGSFEQ